MRYLIWALVALGTYTMVPPLMKVATAEIPSDVAALISNSVLVLVTVVAVVVNDESVVDHLAHPRAPYVYAAGIFLAVGILSYYRALSMGPVSVVAPIFGMFIVTSSLVGIVFLNEAFTPRKGAGIALAVAAVYLTSVE
ncbi:MAG: EamA family transporter [Halobacteria archaeon]|nr:EamA family transporter [Halobacteria archaeon]